MKKEKSMSKSQETVTIIDESKPITVDIIERLQDLDKSSLDLAKAKRESALERARTALAQSEVAELSYNNIILQLALKYHLIDGDLIEDDGIIKRKS